MSRKSFAAALAVTCVGFAGVGVASASAATLLSQNIKLDSHLGDAKSTKVKLASGINYLVTVTGNYSAYDQSLWNNTGRGHYWYTCGQTDEILFPSNGQGAGVGGEDAESLYAGVAKKGCGNYRPPYALGTFEISTDAGATFVNPVPLAGPVVAPDPKHRYTYQVTGAAQKGSFEIKDRSYADNNGVLKIYVRVASDAECDGNGWKKLDFPTLAACQDAVSTMPPVPPTDQ